MILKTGKSPQLFAESVFCWQQQGSLPKGKILRRIGELKEKYNADIRILNTPNMDVASEEIRRKIQQKEDIAGMVPEDVANYIRQNHLYE